MTTDHMILSFRDIRRNMLLGACVVQGVKTLADGVAEAYRLGIYPGGTPIGKRITQAQAEAQGLRVNRLYDRDELVAMGFVDDTWNLQ